MKQKGNYEKKIPMRQCMGCNEHKPKANLVRVVREPEGQIVLDRTGKRSGRGAYICSPECLIKAQKSHRLEHVLECAIPDEVYTALGKEFESYVFTAANPNNHQ